MIINGEKYACESCVRGHRVSNCQHTDRPLQHINKKGRPVSQCQHCRSMRKSRSAHVKCDCGERSAKCVHLQPTLQGHKDSCCCNHGGRCSCALKRDSPALDTVRESDSEKEVSRPTHSTRRRRNTVHSDVSSLLDKTCQKAGAQKSKSTHRTGPYQLSRVNTLANPGSLGSPRDAEASTRRVKSENASPQPPGSPTFSHLGSRVAPLDISQIQYPQYLDDTTTAALELFTSGFLSETDAPLYSAGLGEGSADWGNAADTFSPSSYGQGSTQSYGGGFLDFGSGSEQLPTLASTTTPSGDVSEAEDNPLDMDHFATNYLQQNHLLDGRVDFDAFKDKFPLSTAAVDEDGYLSTNQLSLVEEDPAFFLQNYNDGTTAFPESPDAFSTADGLFSGM